MSNPDSNSNQAGLSYKDAGVDIDAGNALVDRIKPAAKSTRRPGSDTDLGGFGGLFDLKAAGYDDPILVSATDGVGTKLKIAFDMDRHDTVGIDLVAMCVNDLIVQGAEPLLFLDYFATGALSVEAAAQVVEGIAEGCRQSNSALVGGETAEMPGMYQPGHYDLAGFSVGAVGRNDLLPAKNIGAGDVLLGLKSSGVHSNGFSLVRKVIEHDGKTLQDALPFEGEAATLGDALLTPTRIYVKSCLAAIRHGGVKGLCHITGGGLPENMPRVLPDDVAAVIDGASWSLPPVFHWLQTAGNIANAEMLRTFNCGIGMVLVVDADAADAVTAILAEQGEDVVALGSLQARDGEQVIVDNQKALFGQDQQ